MSHARHHPQFSTWNSPGHSSFFRAIIVILRRICQWHVEDSLCTWTFSVPSCVKRFQMLVPPPPSGNEAQSKLFTGCLGCLVSSCWIREKVLVREARILSEVPLSPAPRRSLARVFFFAQACVQLDSASVAGHGPRCSLVRARNDGQ